jgi:hypothetical protein
MVKTYTFLALLGLIAVTASFSFKNADTYNKDESKDIAYYAGLAYCPKKCLEAWNCDGGKNLKHFG